MWGEFQYSFLKYLLKFGGIFCILYFGTLLVIGLSTKENSYSPFVADHLDYVAPLRKSILYSSKFLLNLFGNSSFLKDDFSIYLQNGKGVRIVYSCVGYGVLSFWASFVIANS